eukprot:365404-Chlamydomonas_euryale.AAC.8
MPVTSARPCSNATSAKRHIASSGLPSKGRGRGAEGSGGGGRDEEAVAGVGRRQRRARCGEAQGVGRRGGAGSKERRQRQWKTEEGGEESRAEAQDLVWLARASASVADQQVKLTSKHGCLARQQPPVCWLAAARVLTSSCPCANQQLPVCYPAAARVLPSSRPCAGQHEQGARRCTTCSTMQACIVLLACTVLGCAPAGQFQDLHLPQGWPGAAPASCSSPMLPQGSAHRVSSARPMVRPPPPRCVWLVRRLRPSSSSPPPLVPPAKVSWQPRPLMRGAPGDGDGADAPSAADAGSDDVDARSADDAPPPPPVAAAAMPASPPTAWPWCEFAGCWPGG